MYTNTIQNAQTLTHTRTLTLRLTGTEEDYTPDNLTEMPGLSRQNSAQVTNAENSAQDKRNQLALAKAELLALKRELQIKEEMKKQKKEDNDFATKHSAVIKHIKLKAIAMKWINNTYDKISKHQEKELKDHAWNQCISPDVTFVWDLVQNTQKKPAFVWKSDFIKTANGEWFPYDDPITPPTSPVKNKKGKTFSFGENILEVRVEDGDLTFTQSDMAEHDGPRMTKERAFADMIELWFDQKYTTGTKLYTEFWKQGKILNYKKMGYFKEFGEMMLDALDRYDSGETPAFQSSKSPFKMNDALYNHMDRIHFQYEKHRKVGLNVNAPIFIPQFQ